jgi:acetyl esterase/lipase
MVMAAALAMLALPSVLGCQRAERGGLRGALAQRMAERRQQPVSSLPAGTRVVRDVSYGADPLQRFDVYAPAEAHGAPVVFMVHGGGWERGDKAMANVVQQKVARWVPRGFIVVSTNYRMSPAADPIEQARDVARAMAAAQRQAASWGGDPSRFVLMGHSAGAEIAAYLAASPSVASDAGARPWLGTVLLDGAMLDVAATMQHPHLPLYDAPFGSDPAFWHRASPYEELRARTAPLLAVCSTQRRTSCGEADRFTAKARSFGGTASVLRENLSHMQINAELGDPGAYTAAVEGFLSRLDPGIARLLAR